MSVSEFDLDLDVDVLRCQLLEARNEFEGIADALAFAVETSVAADAARLAASLREKQTWMRHLRTAIRVEEGGR